MQTFRRTSNTLCMELYLLCLSQGRIRGTYGINAKPVVVEPPAESPPAPGVTRASLRPKPTAKASPDEEDGAGHKLPAGLRHFKGAGHALDAATTGLGGDSPKSPRHAKAAAPEGQSQTFLSKRMCTTLCRQ